MTKRSLALRMRFITVRNESGHRTRLTTLRRALNELLSQYSFEGKGIDVLVTDDEAMRNLNKAFRSVDEATDVLSFPGPDWDPDSLGDIAVSMPFAKRGALARGVPVHHELAYLAVHGGLHLLGYDDDTPAKRSDMVERMNKIMTSIGLDSDESWASQPHLKVEGRG